MRRPTSQLRGPRLSGPGSPCPGSPCLGRRAGRDPSAPARGPRLKSCCAACGSTRVTRIAMTLTDGSPVQFTSCHLCEHRSWVQEDRPLPFETVLAKARKPR